MTKRLVTIQDLSCIGRCSLAVAMSIVPAMGIETAALPTAILSTHTAFDGFTFLDFCPEAKKIMRHWQALDMRFDAIYIGYLGSMQLIDMAARFLDDFAGSDTRVIIDPAFGDHGRLYTGFDADYVQAMRRLCARADILLPNVTEACMLLDLPFNEDETTSERLRHAGAALIDHPGQSAIITSCLYPDDRTGLIGLGKHCFDYAHERLPLACHGSGDLFASVFAGLIARGCAFVPAARRAADFVHDCIRNSMCAEDHRWYGVEYEAMLPELIGGLAQLPMEAERHTGG